jgi:ribonuclease P protein component
MTRRLDLPRTARLLDGAQFKTVFAHRRSCGNELFRVHYVPSDQARLGMAVSRRVSRRAVVRNRIRRQIRESFRLWRDRLPPMDYVVVARSAASRADRHALREKIEQLWQRISDIP